MSELNEEELETAARTSYAYWWYVTQPGRNTNDDHDKNNNDDLNMLRFQAAQKEARRHYVGRARDYDHALTSLRRAIALRQEYHVDLLRWMGVPADERPPLDASETERLGRYRSYVADEMAKQPTAVVGVDELQRAIILKGTRNNSETDLEGYLIMQIYVAERAMALTEVASVGRQERVFCVFDFAGYVSAHAPPVLELRGALTDLQSMYKERLHKLIILDPPFLIRALFNIVAPFLDKVTRAKVDMALGIDGRHNLVNASPARQQALAQLLENATGELGYQVSLDTFLHGTSFHEHYDLGSSSAPRSVTVASS